MAQPANPEASPWIGAAASAAAQSRSAIFEMSRQAESAVINPHDAGGFPSEWRRAIAARIATLNALPDLAAHYLADVTDPALRGLANPNTAGRDARERDVITFMDRVATQPRAVQAEEIEGLKTAGIADADIVRLCELNAFMSYQCRVLAGLAALKGASA
uniref:CMD domain protein n=1 Tax=Bosea sp. NBC_00436 TaxID=2969620 RepID=A0A9E8A334_9HYPH